MDICFTIWWKSIIQGEKIYFHINPTFFLWWIRVVTPLIFFYPHDPNKFTLLTLLYSSRFFSTPILFFLFLFFIFYFFVLFFIFHFLLFVFVDYYLSFILYSIFYILYYLFFILLSVFTFSVFFSSDISTYIRREYSSFERSYDH